MPALLKEKALAHPYVSAGLLCALCTIFVPMRYGHTGFGGGALIIALELVGVLAAYRALAPHTAAFARIAVISALSAAVLFFDYLFFTVEKPAQVIAALLFLAILTLFSIWLTEGTLTADRVVFLLFCAGFVLRLTYVIATPLFSYQHDFGSSNNNGHLNYIELLYNKGLTAFPEVTTDGVNQNYHPPLHYMISALWLKIQMFVSQGFSYNSTTVEFCYNNARENLQLLSLFYSTCCMITSYKLLKLFKLKATALVTAFAIIAFHPSLIILGGSCNNDMLSIAFFFAAIYTAVKWYFKPTLLNILRIALSVGLGMMSKLSVAMVAPAIALLFIFKFFKSKAYAKLCLQFAAFGAVCIPAGLWWGIRNLVKSGVPITYVPRINTVNHPQYVGGYTPLQRLFDFRIEDIWMARGEHFGYTHYEYNIGVMIIKTSIFGEYYFGKGYALTSVFAYALFIANLALMLFGLVSLVRHILKKSEFLDSSLRAFFALLYLSVMGFFVKFAFDYPHDCTMDFRYIVPTVLIGALFIAFAMSGDEKKRSSQAISAVVVTVTALFCLSAAVIYLSIGG